MQILSRLHLKNDTTNDEEAEFSRHFSQQLLLSEKLRSKVLIILFSSVFVLFLLFIFIFPEQFEEMFEGNLPIQWVGIFFAGIIAYELIANYFVQMAIRKEKWVPLMRYGNALEEITIPTIGIYLMAHVVDPVGALLGPGSFIYFVFIILGALRLDFKLSVFTGAVAALEYVALSWYWLEMSPSSSSSIIYSMGYHVDRALILLIGGVMIGIVTLEIRKRIRQSFKIVEEKNRVLNTFGQHVSPAVVNKLLAQKAEIDSEERNVCVMFLDIRQFTKFSENKTPEEVVNFLNVFFEAMIEVVNRHHGIINKFLGDGFMAIFGAPLSNENDSLHAVQAGMEMIEKTKELVASGKIPPTRIGIGLHVGNAITGNIGSPLRKEYTVIGDTVNLASRVEQLNKQFDSQFLVTEEILHSIGQQIEGMVPLGKTPVKGRVEPANIYQLA